MLTAFFILVYSCVLQGDGLLFSSYNANILFIISAFMFLNEISPSFFILSLLGFYIESYADFIK